MEKLIVSTAPHLHSGASTQRIMLDVLIALTPAAIASVVLYGLRALLMIVVCVGAAVLSEFLFNIITKRTQTIANLSAAVTGLLLALSLPSTVTIWQCIVGSVFAIIVVKCLFGGLGCNFANPAVTARVMLLIAFSSSVAGGAATNLAASNDVTLVTGATPLSAIKDGAAASELPSLLDMFLGNRGGAIGEGCILALVIGCIYLIVRRVIHWETPVIAIGTVYLLSLAITGDPTIALYEILGGGLVIAAVFMITDYVTTPTNRLGKMVFAFGMGLITVLIRFWGSYPEGVSFAVLLMNILSPYIEKLCAKKPFGGVKAK